MKRKKTKVLLILAVTLGALGLASCSGTVENQNSTTRPPLAEQGVGETSSGSTDANPSTNEQDLPQEQLFGAIQTIDGMTITIDTSRVIGFGGGQHFISGEVDDDDSVEEEYLGTIIHLTEQTIIEVRTTAGGQIAGTRSGTLDDLSLQATVMATGQWQGNEFTITELIIFSL